MATVEQLLVTIDATTESLRRELSRADAAVEGFGRNVGKNVDAVQRNLDTLAAKTKSMADQVNANLRVATDFNAEGRARDIQAYGRELDALRAKYNPLFAAQQAYRQELAEINRAQKVGAISQAEQTAAITRTKAAFVEQVQVIRTGGQQMAGTFALSRQGLLSLQASGVNAFQALASGISADRVVMTEGAQVLGAFVQDGLLTTKMLIGVGGAIAGVAAVAGTFAIAIAKGVAESKEFERVQHLTANAAGLTADSLEGIVAAASASGNVGIATARGLAMEFASTGKIGSEVIGKLTAMTADYAEATGQSAEDAGKALAKQFADPLKGAQQLDDAYNLLTVAQRDYIRTLAEQGDRTGAQVVLADALNDRIKHLADDGLTWLGRRLRDVTGFWNEFWDAAKGIGRGPTIEEQIAAARERLSVEQTTGASPERIAKRQQQIASLQGEKFVQDAAARTAEETARFQEQTKALDSLTRGYEGFASKQERLHNESVAFANGIAMVQERIDALGEAGLGSAGLSTLLEMFKRLKLGAADVQAEIAAMLTPLQASHFQTVNARLISATPPSQRSARSAFLTELDRASHGTREEQQNALTLAQEAATRATLAQNTAISDQNSLFALNSKENAKVADAYLQSASAGMKAEAHQKAANESFQNGVDIQKRAHDILSAQVDSTITAGAKVVEQLGIEARQREAVAKAALSSAEAQRQAEIQAKIDNATLAERTALQNADDQQTKRLNATIAAKTKAITDEAEATRDLASAQALRGQNEQLQMLKAQMDVIGKTNAERVVELAHVQALIDLHKKEGDVLTENEKLYIAHAEQIARETREVNRMQAAIDELGNFASQAFDRIGSALTEAFVQGKDSAVSFASVTKGLISELYQGVLKLSLLNPLKNWLTGSDLPTLGGIFGRLTGASNSSSGSSGGGISPLSFLNAGGTGGLFNSFATSSVGQFLGLSTPVGAAAGPTLLGAGGATAFTGAQEAGLIAGGWTGAAPTALAGSIGAALPYIGAAIAIAAPLLMSMFGRKPSVGPTTVGRITDLTNPGSAVYTFDNGGNDATTVKGVIKAIVEGIKQQTRNFGGTLNPGSGFDVGFFPSPESGNSQASGFNLKAIIDNVLEQKDRFKGLSEQEAVSKATYIALKDMVTYQSATLEEIRRSTQATDLPGLIADLDFGKNFDRLTAALDSLGGDITANTLATAQETVARQKAAEDFAKTNAQPIVDAITKAIELFQPVGGNANAGAVGTTQALADAVRGAVLESDAGAIRGMTKDFQFVASGSGRENSYFQAGSDRYDLRKVAANNRSGVAFDLVNASGEVVKQFESMQEALAGAGSAIAGYVQALNEQQGASARTAEEQTRYNANLDRVGKAVDIAKAGVQLLVDQITGSFEPAIKGPFQSALETGQANLDALRPYLEDVNSQIREANKNFPELGASLIDINDVIATATATLKSELQDQFNKSIQTQLNSATGLGAINTISDLVKARDTNIADARALGIALPTDGSNSITKLFEAQIKQALQGASLSDLNRILTSGQVTDNEALSVIRDLMSDPALPAFVESVKASVTAIDDEISARKSSVDALNEAIAKLQEGRLSRSLNPQVSIFDPQEQLRIALEEFNRISALAQGGNVDAIAKFDQTASATLDAALTAYGRSDQRYAAIFNKIQTDSVRVESLTAQQVSIAQQQLEELTAIREGLAGQAGVANRDYGANPTRNRAVAALFPEFTGNFGAGAFNEFLSGQISQNDPRRATLANLIATINFANGGAFANGMPVNYFASGTVVSQPTLFGMRGSLGMMGEAGPEAIMPLERINGRLGVRAIGAANDNGGSAQAIALLGRMVELLDASVRINGAGNEELTAEVSNLRRDLRGFAKEVVRVAS